MPKIQAVLLAGAAAALALVIACGGGDDDSSSNNGAGAGPIASGALQTISLSQSAEKLGELTSFRFDMSLDIDLGDAAGGGEDAQLAAALLAAFSHISASGAYVAPDQIEVVAEFAGQEFGYIQIGDEAWENTGAGWQPTEAGTSMFGGNPSEMFTEFLPEDVLDVANATVEEVNGVSTIRYSFDKDSLEQAATALGEETAGFAELSKADMDLWLSADGVPVKILIDMAGADDEGGDISFKLEMNITEINSDSLEIKRPE